MGSQQRIVTIRKVEEIVWGQVILDLMNYSNFLMRIMRSH